MTTQQAQERRDLIDRLRVAHRAAVAARDEAVRLREFPAVAKARDAFELLQEAVAELVNS